MIKYFIECLVPETRCNLQCQYCYVKAKPEDYTGNEKFLFPVPKMIGALTTKRLGGTCYFSLCGAGETLLKREVVDLIVGLVNNGHFINVTTNGTSTSRYKEIASLIPPPLHGKVNFSLSFHYDELKRTNTLKNYFSNVTFLVKEGFSVLCQINLVKSYLQKTNEIQKLFIDNIGCLPQAVLTRDGTDITKIYNGYDKKTYEKAGSSYHSPLFDFTLRNHNSKINVPCYAGYRSFTLNLGNGQASACYSRGWKLNLFENPEAKINPIPIVRCALPFCINGSHFCALGIAPQYHCKTYYALRNRYSTTFYRDLITPDIKSFADSKFPDPLSGFNLEKKLAIKLAFKYKFFRKILKFINWN